MINTFKSIINFVCIYCLLWADQFLIFMIFRISVYVFFFYHIANTIIMIIIMIIH